jgi:hypothetical protein
LNQPDISNAAEPSQHFDTSEASKLSQISEPPNTLNKDNAFVQLNNSAVSNITQKPDNSSEIDTEDLTEKESWEELTYRHNYLWISALVVLYVVVVVVSCSYAQPYHSSSIRSL